MWFAVLFVALAWGWFWNAIFGVADVTSVHTAWTVNDSEANKDNYHAEIVLYYPRGAEIDILEVADLERVRKVEDDDLKCSPDGLELRATWTVHSKRGSDGDRVETALVSEEGFLVGNAEGRINRRIIVEGFLPTDGFPACAMNDRRESRDRDRDDDRGRGDDRNDDRGRGRRG